MASNIAVKISADTSSLTAQCAVASAQSRALSTELNNLAKQAAAAGAATPELTGQLQQVAAQLVSAKEKVSDLKSQLNQGKSSFTDFSGATTLAKEALGAFGVTLSLGAIVQFGKSVFDASEEIYHEAEVLGLSTTAYQAFSEGGKLAGVSVEAIDRALIRFNAAQGLAQTGLGAQAKAFNDLGVSANLPAEQALPAIARALLAIEDPARRSRDEVALFGRAGEQLNPLLETWATGVGALTEKLRDLGLIQEDEVVKGAHDAKVAMTTAWDQVITQAAPQVVAFTGFLTDLIKTYQQLESFAERGWGSGKSVSMDMPEGFLAGSGGTPKPLGGAAAPGATPQPRPNWTDDADAKKAAQQARQIADEQAKAFEDGNLKHIESEAQTNAFLLEMGQETVDQWKAQAVEEEDAKYAAEVDYLKKKEAADASDKVKEAADKAQEAQLYQEHTDRLTAIDQEYQQKKKQLDQASLQDFMTAEDAKLAAAIASLDKQYQAQQISADQKHSSDVQLTLAIESEVLKRFDIESAGLAQGTEAYEKAMKQREEIVQKFGKDVASYDKQNADVDAQAWSSANKEILSGENSMINGFLTGRGTMGENLLKMTGQFLEREIDSDIDYWTERLLLSAEFVGKEKITEQGGLLVKLIGNQQLIGNTVVTQAQMTAVTQAGENAKVQATLAANAAITASDSGTAVSSSKAIYGGYFAAIQADAAKAFADVYAWASPVLGPFAAVPAGAAYALVAAKSALIPSLDVGTNYVASSGLAMIHQGEAIVPAAYNPANGGSAANGGPGGGDTYNINISAVDAQSVQRLFAQNGQAIVASLAAQRRSLNPNFNGART